MASYQLDNVSVSFPSFSTEAISLRNYLLKAFSTRYRANYATNYALNGVSVEINDGDRVGLIGLNGAGKSSFLRLLAGIYQPNTGTVKVEGSVSTLLDLNLGMDEEATGYENIEIVASLFGYNRQQIEEITPEIEEFTELGEHLNKPIKAYSSGMRVRLAFALATCQHSEIMLIDEIIGVGDAAFLAKAAERMIGRIDKSKILVLASHSEKMLTDFCNKGLIFNKGKIVKALPIAEAIDFYNNEIVPNA